MVTMTRQERQELINRVVCAYFAGEDWRTYLKELVKQMKRGEEREENMSDMPEVQQAKQRVQGA